ncbi:hypothetical protein P7C71_g3306, partial [Lecanoromycetidae sp. Uapishka_2]
MDPITAIGLASAIVAFVDIGMKMAKRIRELSEAGDIPDVFRDIKTRLPLIVSIVDRTQRGTEDLSPEAEKAFQHVVSQCFEQVSQLDEVLNKVVIFKGDSRLKKKVKVFVSLKEEPRVQRIATAIMDNIQLLTSLNVISAERKRPEAERKPSEPLPSYLGNEESKFDEAEIRDLLEILDNLPLAVSQAAAFIKQNRVSIADYTNALKGKEVEELLSEELNDSRRDEESVNSVFRTWKLSYDQIKQQKPRAAELLSLLAMLDRQSVPKSLLKVPEVTTSLGVLQSFNLVTTRAGLQSFQIHRLVQLFVQLSLQKDKTTQKWQEAALACVSKDYPTEIGVAEWPICDALAPHVHIITEYKYETTEALLDLAHLLCWAADFDIERGMYTQALERAGRSLRIFRQLVPEDDERLAAATWLYGRLRYYQAQSTADIEEAAELLQKALEISRNPSLNFAESAFELAHLYYDQCNEEACLEMGKASFECWEKLEGPSSVRTLDNMHDYALELAMLGHEKDGIALWQEIVERCPASDASENTKTVYTYRSMAGIAEFQRDAAMAEIFYAKLIMLCGEIYNSEHIHVFDYRLSHAEQVMRQDWSLITALEQQGKMKEALEVRAGLLELEAPTDDRPEGRRLPTNPPARDDRRFGRMIHPRTWSA